MKYKSVEELNDKIMEAIEEDDNFEAYLFGKYPKLFPCDEHGQLLPQSQRCWNDCPDGWRDIVDSLFGCIDDYVSHYKHTEINPKRKLRYKLRKAYWKYVRDPIYRLTPLPIKSSYTKNFSPTREKEIQEEHNKAQRSWQMKVRRVVSAVDLKLFNRNDLYIGVSPPHVVIDQYKEKFGTLRVYYDGGDDVVKGMVRYAEHLASLTCQSTGKRGQLCKRGMWYATLSDEAAKKADYKPVDEEI
jgi:hypothetical protein